MLKKALVPLCLLLLVACGGSSKREDSGSKENSESREDSNSSNTASTSTTFQGKELYTFKLNPMVVKQRYTLQHIEGMAGHLSYEYFNFDTDNYEVDSTTQQIFVNTKRASSEDISYDLNTNGTLVASLNDVEISKLTLLKEEAFKATRSEAYASNITMEGKVYETNLAYEVNFYKVQNLADTEVFENLETFVAKYQSKNFEGSVLNGLRFGENNELLQQVESTLTTAGNYEIKTVESQEILFLNPKDEKRYGKNRCYILDFSRVWKSECHLKGTEEQVKFYDQDVYEDVLKYMQTAFIDFQVSI